MILLLGGDTRAFLPERLDRRLVLPVLRRGLLRGGPAAVAAEHGRLAAAVARIVGHLVVLVERLLGRIGIVLVLAHQIVLEGLFGEANPPPAGGFRGAAGSEVSKFRLPRDRKLTPNLSDRRDDVAGFSP